MCIINQKIKPMKSADDEHIIMKDCGHTLPSNTQSVKKQVKKTMLKISSFFNASNNKSNASTNQNHRDFVDAAQSFGYNVYNIHI